MAATGVQLDPLQLEATVGWDDNVGRAAHASARAGDRIHTISISRSATTMAGTNTRLLASVFLLGEEFARYKGLGRVSAGANAQLQYRSSGAFSAPTFALFTDVQRDQYRAGDRTGMRYAVGASVRQSWTERIDFHAAASMSRRDARATLFDQGERSLRMRLDYATRKFGTAYAGAEVRAGDVVSSSLGYDDEYARAALAHGPDGAFGPAYHAYRLEGLTRLITVGWNLPLGPTAAIDLSWRGAYSSASIPATDVNPGETLRYRSNLYSLSYLHRF